MVTLLLLLTIQPLSLSHQLLLQLLLEQQKLCWFSTILVSGALSGTIGANVTAMSGTPTGLPLIGNTMTLANGSNTLGTMNS